MCSQCMTNPNYYNSRVFGMGLMRATKNDYDTNPTWEKDEFGIIECNDPTFYFKTLPVEVKPEWLEIPDSDPTDMSLPDYPPDYVKALEVATNIEEEILSSSELRFSSLKRLFDTTSKNYPNAKAKIAIMYELYLAIQSGFRTNAEVEAEIEKELENEEKPLP